MLLGAITLQSPVPLLKLNRGVIILVVIAVWGRSMCQQGETVRRDQRFYGIIRLGRGFCIEYVKFGEHLERH